MTRFTYLPFKPLWLLLPGLLLAGFVAPATATPVTYSNQGARGIPTLSFGSRHLFADLDNDGDLDVLYQTGNTNGTGIAVQLNTGGTYGTAITATSGTGAFTSGPLNGISFSQIGVPTLSVVDLNSDGYPDLVECLNSTAPRWIKNNGNGTFTASTIASLQALTFGARQVFLDLDNDGDEDILYQNGNTNGTGIAVQLNAGNGTFGTAVAATSGTGAFTSGPLNGISITTVTGFNDRIVDVDDDGDEDIVEFFNSTAPRWLQNNGNGTFTAATISSLPTLTFGTRQVFLDADADGDPDILYQNGNTSGTGIALQLNNGTGGFATAITATSGTGAFTGGPLNGISFAQIVAGNTDVADYDSDNDPDLFDFTNAVAPIAFRQDGTRPLLSSTSPADNATGVSLTANITLTFDRSVVKGTGNLYLVKTATGVVVQTAAVTGSAVSGSGTTWTYDPTVALSGNTGYALRADEETFIDADGRVFFGIPDTTTLNFTTGAAPSITTAALTASAYCAGGQLAVSFSSAALTPSAGNVYTAQLSNASGAFTAPVTIGTLSSTANSGSIGATLPVATATGTGYRIRLVSSAPAVIGADNGSNLSITAPASDAGTYYLANASATQAATLSTGIGYTYTDASCRAIAAIMPTGAGMGSTTARVYLQSSAPVANATAYVRRYYDFTPASNASTATATLTLYYTQADFTNYNSNNGTAPDLPTGPGDAAGIANLRITQQHGTSGSGAPGTYTGWSGTGSANRLIDPVDANVVWNGSLNRWEVTISVTGFSGFFVHGGGSTALPARLQSFAARRDGSQVRIDWKMASEAAGTGFVLERSGDGSRFSAIDTRAGDGRDFAYCIYDTQPLTTLACYRLKMTDPSGAFGWSETVAVHSAPSAASVSVSPVPASSVVHIVLGDPGLNGLPAVLRDGSGAIVRRFLLQAQQDLDVRDLPPGVYSLQLPGGTAVKLVKE